VLEKYFHALESLFIDGKVERALSLGLRCGKVGESTVVKQELQYLCMSATGCCMYTRPALVDRGNWYQEYLEGNSNKEIEEEKQRHTSL
jgi:hypothetical protein